MLIFLHCEFMIHSQINNKNMKEYEMNLYDELSCYQKQLRKHGIKVDLLFPDTFKDIRLPFSRETQKEIFDLIIIYFIRKYNENKYIDLVFHFEKMAQNGIVVIMPKMKYKTKNCTEVQEFFWTMHLIFKNLLEGKSMKAWGNFSQDKFKLQIPLWCKAV